MSGVNYVLGINNCGLTSFMLITIKEVKALLLVLLARSGEGQFVSQTCDINRRFRWEYSRKCAWKARFCVTSGRAALSVGEDEEMLTLLTTADCKLMTLVGVRRPILQGCYLSSAESHSSVLQL